MIVEVRVCEGALSGGFSGGGTTDPFTGGAHGEGGRRQVHIEWMR